LIFCLLLTVGAITLVLKGNKVFRSYYNVKIKLFRSLLACRLTNPDPDSFHIITEPDPDPGGPKQSGSYEAESGPRTLLKSRLSLRCCRKNVYFPYKNSTNTLDKM
jgi:hypothetical protein